MRGRAILAGWALAILVTAATVPSLLAQSPALLLFGGHGHDVFLGCLNCSPFDRGSVCNEFGNHGSPFARESIWNEFGSYGSAFSSTSPWNEFASDPPVIVDREGNFYGYFTANQMHPRRTRNEFFLLFLDNADAVTEDLDHARELFCRE